MQDVAEEVVNVKLSLERVAHIATVPVIFNAKVVLGSVLHHGVWGINRHAGRFEEYQSTINRSASCRENTFEIMFRI